MTTKEFLQREIRRTDIAIRRAERKPNAPEDELQGLREKRDHLQEALAAVDDYWRRVHQERVWSDNGPAADVRPVARGRWEWHGPCRDSNGKFWATCSACRERQRLGDFQRFCPSCGADMREESHEIP